MKTEVSVKQNTIKPGNNCNHAKILAICRGARKENVKYVAWIGTYRINLTLPTHRLSLLGSSVFSENSSAELSICYVPCTPCVRVWHCCTYWLFLSHTLTIDKCFSLLFLVW